MKRLLLAIASLCLASAAAAEAQQRAPELSPKEAARAEKLLAGIERLDASAPDNRSTQKARSLSGKLSTKIRRDIYGLPDGDFKTDLSTALLFYERAAASSNEQPSPRHERCEQERPGLYRKLCETAHGDPHQLLLNKARLHAAWARASLNALSGAVDEKTVTALSQIETERRLDREMAESALGALARLESEVRIYRTLGEFIEGRALARVSFETFTTDLEEASHTIKANLYRLPESSLKNELRNALLSYLDGRFWWSKVYHPAVIHAGNSYAAAEAPMPPSLSDPEAIKYTVVINWRQARQYTGRAAQLLKKMR